MKSYWVYIITNINDTVLYTGVTGNLGRRAYEHKNKLIDGFSSRYNLCKLVYLHEFYSSDEAIAAEKKIKGWTRAKKEKLIEANNPGWRDLAEDDLI